MLIEGNSASYELFKRDHALRMYGAQYARKGKVTSS